MRSKGGLARAIAWWRMYCEYRELKILNWRFCKRLIVQDWVKQGYGHLTKVLGLNMIDCWQEEINITHNINQLHCRLYRDVRRPSKSLCHPVLGYRLIWNKENPQKYYLGFTVLDLSFFIMARMNSACIYHFKNCTIGTHIYKFVGLTVKKSMVL